MNHWLDALIFGMDHPQDQEIQVSSNEVLGVTNGHALRGHRFTLYIAKTFKNLLMNHGPRCIKK